MGVWMDGCMGGCIGGFVVGYVEWWMDSYSPRGTCNVHFLFSNLQLYNPYIYTMILLSGVEEISNLTDSYY